MAKIEVQKASNFTAISNTALQDRNISIKSRGFLAYMLSLPNDWDFSVNGLSVCTGEGRDSVKNALRELEMAGYLVRKQGRAEAGKFSKTDFILYEQPLTEKPSTAKPSTGEPLTANPTQQNNNKQNNNKQNNNKQNNNKQNNKRESNSALDWFEKFWEIYPRKLKRVTARIAFMSLPYDEALYQKIIDAVERHKATKQWQDLNFVPFAENFLQDERWEDEIPEINNDDVWGSALSTLGDEADVSD